MFASRSIELPIWKTVLIFFVVLSAIKWGFMSFLYGQAYNQIAYLPNIPILVLNLDNGPIGDQLINTFPNMSPKPGYTQSSEIKDLQSAIDAVDRGDYWGAVIARPEASKRLADAITAATSNNTAQYDPTQAYVLVYDEGRNPLIVASAVINPMRGLIQQTIRGVVTGNLKNNGVVVPLLLRSNPALVVSPVAFTEMNLHPNTVPVLNLANAFGQVFLMVFSIFVAVIVMTTTKLAAASLPPLTTLSLRLRLLFPFVFLIPLWSTLTLTVFGVSWPSAGAFVSHWFLQILTSCTYIFLFFTIFILQNISVPPPAILPLILWVIFNVVGGIGTIELAHEFYRFGYGLPIWNNATATRWLIYGSYNRIGMNVGIIAGWLGLFFLVYLVLQVSGKEKEGLKKFAKEQEMLNQVQEDMKGLKNDDETA